MNDREMIPKNNGAVPAYVAAGVLVMLVLAAILLVSGVYSLDEAEQARWREKVAPILNDYVANMAQKNLPGDKFLAELQAKLAASANR